MHAAVQRRLSLRIDISLPHEATEGRLDVSARTAEAIVEIEVTESGVEIVAPEQCDYAPA